VVNNKPYANYIGVRITCCWERDSLVLRERARHAKRESERTKCARCRNIQITDWSMRDADSRCYNSNNTPSRIAVVLSGQTWYAEVRRCRAHDSDAWVDRSPALAVSVTVFAGLFWPLAGEKRVVIWELSPIRDRRCGCWTLFGRCNRLIEKCLPLTFTLCC